ncbi:MAG: DUF4870 domain-containing protein [Candidatus Acidiferrum sp.]
MTLIPSHVLLIALALSISSISAGLDGHSLAGSASEISLRAASRFVTLQPKLVLWRDPLMAFCKACGQEIGTATFCPKCGANQSSAVAPSAAPAANPTEGLAENVAGLLCYAVGFVTGIVFFLIDKRPFVKFHAAQSIVVFGGLFVIQIGLSFMAALIHGLIGFGLAGLLESVVGLVAFILWIMLMFKAYQHETFRVPIAADIADGLAKN